MSVKKIVTTALLSSMALIVFIIENAIPPLLPIAPGVKLGLSNIFIMFAVISCGNMSGLIVAVVKSLLGSIFSGNMFALLYSFPASVVSLLVFIFLYKFLYKKISVACMSVVCSVVFNTCQIITASLVLQSAAVYLYLPYVLIMACITGLFTGSVIFFIIKAYPYKFL